MDQYENQNYGNQNGGKKSSSKVLVIALVAVLALLIGVSTFFVVREITKAVSTASGKQNVAADESKSVKEQTKVDTNQSTENVIKVSESSEIAKTTVQNGVVLMDVSEVVENVMPSIVSIVDTLEYTQSYNPYNYFFGGSSGSLTQQTASSGTGVIIGTSDTELLIVTNKHVVTNEETTSSYKISSKGLTVTFCDGTSAGATVKGTDTNTDLAVISIQLSEISSETKDQIKIAVVGSSDNMKVGEGVIVIGNAGGYGQSVTVGVLSAKERSITIDGVTRALMQTDAAINPGNSGGGMFNVYGELIGINSAKTVSTDIEGMGFAIPISSVISVIENLMNTVQIPAEQQGYLGISGESVPSNYIAAGYPAGVSVSRIYEGSPAEKAGIQYYDIIAKINDQEVTTIAELKAVTNSYPAGTTVTLTVYRAEGRSFKSFTVDVTLATYEEISRT